MFNVDRGTEALFGPHDDVPGDCISTVLAVSVDTPRERYADPRTATQDVARVIRSALGRDFLAKGGSSNGRRTRSGALPLRGPTGPRFTPMYATSG
jgi:hypothetical protein